MNQNYSVLLSNLFAKSAGVILLVTSVAKLISSTSRSPLMSHADPLLDISFRHLLMIAGSVELICAGFCLLSKRIVLNIKFVAWLATCIALYRIGLVFIGWRKPCPCLGYLTDAINIQSGTADAIMKCVLIFLLIGSYGSLYRFWRQRSAKAADFVV